MNPITMKLLFRHKNINHKTFLKIKIYKLRKKNGSSPSEVLSSTNISTSDLFQIFMK